MQSTYLASISYEIQAIKNITVANSIKSTEINFNKTQTLLEA
jgi:hypothetical protein